MLSSTLEKAIRNVGEFMEAQSRDGYDPVPSIKDTLKILDDRFETVGKPAYSEAFREAGLQVTLAQPTFRENMRKLIELADQTGSDAAAKIKESIALERELRKQHPELNGVSGDSSAEVERILHVSKTSGLHL